MAGLCREGALAEKLRHSLIDVRERALSSIYSKVIISGLVSIDSFPAFELAKGLLGLVTDEKYLERALSLVSSLSQTKQGAQALREA
jgi:hypothetical protein